MSIRMIRLALSTALYLRCVCGGSGEKGGCDVICLLKVMVSRHYYKTAIEEEAFPGGAVVKNLPAKTGETRVQCLEYEMATHCGTVA